MAALYGRIRSVSLVQPLLPVQADPHQWDEKHQHPDRRNGRMLRPLRLVGWALLALATIQGVSWLCSSSPAIPVPDPIRSRISSIAAPFNRHPSTRPSCEDPFAESGWLRLTPASQGRRESASWVPLDPSCPPQADWIEMIRYPPPPGSPVPLELQFLANKSIAIVGDSVDRNGLMYSCEIMQPAARLTMRKFSDKDFIFKPDTPREKDEDATSPYVCEVDWLGLRLFNFFHYGLDDQPVHADNPDWTEMSMIEHRYEKLFEPYLRQWGISFDLVSMQSSLWDLYRWGVLDVTDETPPEPNPHRLVSQTDLAPVWLPLDEARTTLWQNRARWFIRKTKEVFSRPAMTSSQSWWGSSPQPPSFVWRATHRPARRQTKPFTSDPFDILRYAATDYFGDLRVHQLREMATYVAKGENVKIMDFGRLYEGWQQLGAQWAEDIHPALYPAGGHLYLQELLQQLKIRDERQRAW